eukprot:jgi/Bigna1/126766/aug1.3_g1474
MGSGSSSRNAEKNEKKCCKADSPKEVVARDTGKAKCQSQSAIAEMPPTKSDSDSEDDEQGTGATPPPIAIYTNGREALAAAMESVSPQERNNKKITGRFQAAPSKRTSARLLAASARADLEAVKRLIDKKASVNSLSESVSSRHYRTPLMEACLGLAIAAHAAEGSLSTRPSPTLADAPAAACSPRDKGEEESMLRQRISVVRYLIQEGSAKVDARDKKRRTALMQLCSVRPLSEESSMGTVELYGMVRYLVEEARADVDAKNKFGWTALQSAVSMSLDRSCHDHSFRMLKYLVEKAGAMVNTRDVNGVTALMDVAAHGKSGRRGEEVVENKKVLAETTMEEEGKKERNAENCPQKLIRQLGKKGSSEIQKEQEEGRTEESKRSATSIKSNNGSSGSTSLIVARYLVEEAHANINIRNNEGHTALMLARDADVRRYLVEMGADVDAQDDRGWTALFFATENGDLDAARYLVEKARANPTIENLNGFTAHCAESMPMLASTHNFIKRGRLKTRRYLMEASCQVKVINFYRTISTLPNASFDQSHQ